MAASSQVFFCYNLGLPLLLFEPPTFHQFFYYPLIHCVMILNILQINYVI